MVFFDVPNLVLYLNTFLAFYLAFCKSIETGNGKGGRLRPVVVCSLGYSPTVDLDNRAKRLLKQAGVTKLAKYPRKDQ